VITLEEREGVPWSKGGRVGGLCCAWTEVKDDFARSTARHGAEEEPPADGGLRASEGDFAIKEAEEGSPGRRSPGGGLPAEFGATGREAGFDLAASAITLRRSTLIVSWKTKSPFSTLTSQLPQLSISRQGVPPKYRPTDPAVSWVWKSWAFAAIQSLAELQDHHPW